MPPQLRGHRASRPPRLGGDGQRHGLGLVRLLPLLFQPQPTLPHYHIHSYTTQTHTPRTTFCLYVPAIPASMTLCLHTLAGQVSRISNTLTHSLRSLSSLPHARLQRCSFRRACSPFMCRLIRVLHSCVRFRRACALSHTRSVRAVAGRTSISCARPLRHPISSNTRYGRDAVVGRV